MAAAAVTRGTITRSVGVDRKGRRQAVALPRRQAFGEKGQPLRGANAWHGLGSPIARKTRISNFALANGEEIHPAIIIPPCPVAICSQQTAFLADLSKYKASASGYPLALSRLWRSSGEGAYPDTLAHHLRLASRYCGNLAIHPAMSLNTILLLNSWESPKPDKNSTVRMRRNGA